MQILQEAFPQISTHTNEGQQGTKSHVLSDHKARVHVFQLWIHRRFEALMDQLLLLVRSKATAMACPDCLFKWQIENSHWAKNSCNRADWTAPPILADKTRSLHDFLVAPFPLQAMHVEGSKAHSVHSSSAEYEHPWLAPVRAQMFQMQIWGGWPSACSSFVTERVGHSGMLFEFNIIAKLILASCPHRPVVY